MIYPRVLNKNEAPHSRAGGRVAHRAVREGRLIDEGHPADRIEADGGDRLMISESHEANRKSRLRLDGAIRRLWATNRILSCFFVFLLFPSFSPAFGQSLTILTEIALPWQGQAANGAATGPIVEVVREIQKRVGNSDPIQVYPWARIYEMIRKNPDVVAFTMGRNADRNKLFQWVGPVNEGIYGLYVRTDSAVVLKTLEDAKELTSIGVIRGDIRTKLFIDKGFKNLEEVSENDQNVKKLMLGRIDAMTSSDASIIGIITSAGFNPKDVRLALPFFHTQGWIAFSAPTSPDIVKSWQNALDGMRRDGSQARIIKKYIPDYELPGPPIVSF
jgi:polar amino acid transport system substrate-binding protein